MFSRTIAWLEPAQLRRAARPAPKIVIDRAARRQILGQGCLLAPGAQDIQQLRARGLLGAIFAYAVKHGMVAVWV
jgi:hypothetical protein